MIYRAGTLKRDRRTAERLEQLDRQILAELRAKVEEQDAQDWFDKLADMSEPGAMAR